MLSYLEANQRDGDDRREISLFAKAEKEGMVSKLKVLFLSAEAVPFAKTGGLADVAGALPKALQALGHDVRIAMPRYGRIEPSKFGLTLTCSNLTVPVDSTIESVSILQGNVGAVPVYFVDSAKYFDREGIYGYPDDGERFIVFCRAALEMLRQLQWKPDVIHCNDWHTGIVPNWLRTIYADDPFLKGTASVFTVHNLQYQGIFGQRILEIAGIDQYGFLYHPDVADLANVVDLLARGLLFADIINTVSEKYAQEILTPEFGEHLDPLLRDRQDRLFGILNGLDYDEFNPSTDPHLAVRYDVDTLDQKLANKLALQSEANLSERPDVPLMGIVSRLADQKGFDLLARIFEDVMNVVDTQFVLLGTGDQHYHNMFTDFARQFKKRAAIFLTFNASLAQRIYAGCDMFLMPSRFEPCGLGQLISMRYGTVPVVRRTGGLADTIKDFNPLTGEGNGFGFERYHHMDLFATIVRAVENYRHRDTWRMLQKRGMSEDYSWATAARKYVDLYRKAVDFARNPTGDRSPAS